MKIGAALQMVSIEVGRYCNLTGIHHRCPISLGLDRYRGLPTDQLLSDDAILDLVSRWYDDYDFRGVVNWNYYNEPLQKQGRMFQLMARIRERAPELAFVLITNGTLLPEDLEPFRAFKTVFITDYGGTYAPDPERLARLIELVGEFDRHQVTGVSVREGKLDGRMRQLGPDRSACPCVLPLKEWVVDAYGNVHLCCLDWRGLASPGNIMRDGFEACLERWRAMTTSLVQTPMGPDAHDACRHCQSGPIIRLPRVDPAARARGKRWLRGDRA